ncbi:hypothetical protein PM082_014220 [Marasmius tenuissimus]|nr:hypothetical protein PM082_014220 [Marasmius tenuissimus]
MLKPSKLAKRHARKAKQDLLGPQTFNLTPKPAQPTDQTSYLHLESFSADGKRIQRWRVHFHSKENQARIQAFDKLNLFHPTEPDQDYPFKSIFQLLVDDDLVHGMEDMAIAKGQQKKMTAKSVSLAEPMQDRKGVASTFLDEMMALDGRGYRKQDSCLECKATGALYRCWECIREGCSARIAL